MARAGNAVTLLTVQSEDVASSSVAGLQLITCRPSFPKLLSSSRALRDRLTNSNSSDVWHGHGLWHMPVHYMADIARKRGIPYLIAPVGMLEPWALGRSPWKKRVVARLYQNEDLRKANCLHALNMDEANHFRDYGLGNPIAVVPNGVELSALGERAGKEALLMEQFPKLKNRPIVLFLSRIHPKKGLLHLVEAWAQIRRDYPDWILLIAGPDEGGHQAQVEKGVAALDISDSVLFTGPLYENLKLAALSAADLFVLPSFSEGFSVAVLEAMACKLPVLITPGCNFAELQVAGAGFICEPTARGVERGLRRLMGMAPGGRLELGQKGRKLIEGNYTWDKLAGDMLDVYDWLVRGRSAPGCVLE